MTEINKEIGNINDILNMMNRANEGFNYPIYIPSLEKSIMFRQINTSQQKRLLKSIIDNPAFNTEFIYTIRQIIKENCTESIDIDNLTIFDKLIVCINMRSYSIGNDFEIQFTNPNTNKPITNAINLKDLSERLLSSIKISSKNIKDESGTFDVLCNLPTIGEEFKLEDELRKHVSNVEIKDVNELRTTVGNIFTNEIVKYIKQIKFTLNDKIIEIPLKEVNFKERLTIIERLPAKVTNKITEYIKEINEQFDNILLFKYLIPSEKDSDGKIIKQEQTIEQRLKIDANFFTAS